MLGRPTSVSTTYNVSHLPKQHVTEIALQLQRYQPGRQSHSITHTYYKQDRETDLTQPTCLAQKHINSSLMGLRFTAQATVLELHVRGASFQSDSAQRQKLMRSTRDAKGGSRHVTGAFVGECRGAGERPHGGQQLQDHVGRLARCNSCHPCALSTVHPTVAVIRPLCSGSVSSWPYNKSPVACALIS